MPIARIAAPSNGPSGEATMHSQWLAPPPVPELYRSRSVRFLGSRRDPRSGAAFALSDAPTGPRPPHGEDRQRLERGKSDDQGSRTRDRACIVPARGSRDRVRHDRLHAGLPGYRNRGRRRRRVTSDRFMIRGKGGACRLPLLVIAIALWGAVLAPAWGAESVYRRPLNNDPATLDPARVGDIYSRSVAQQIFDGLVQFDRTLTVTPALAQHWKASRDGLVWTFSLRRGVKFHHGREVTADDVVYSFSRIVDPKTRSAAADLFLNIKGAAEFRQGRTRHISGLSAVDRHTVEVTLTEALVPFVSVLAVGHAKIVPREVVEQKGDDAFGTAPVGTGPFRFVKWERGREIALAANPDYFAGPPRVARLVYRIFPGAPFDAVYEEFQRGQLEDTPPPVRDYRRAVAAAGESYVKRPLLSVRFYGFNTRLKPLADRLVRQALTYA